MLFDMNNLAVRCYFNKEIEAESGYPNIKLWKYFVIDSIYKSLFKERYVNEVILAIDDKVSWRKLYWNRYKESRKKKRDVAKIDWNVFHEEYRNFCEEISKTLPFKIIQVENAEADDIIAVMATKDNGEYVIVSNDEDYLQLISDRVVLYNPQKMEFMKCDNPELFLVRKCLEGQKKDDIFNIKTPLDWPEDKRKPGFGPAAADKVVSYPGGYQKWLVDNKLVERYNVNRILIDFNKIPKIIRSRIMSVYNSYKLPDPSGFYNYFERLGFRGYLEDFSTVESKLMSLY